MDWASILGQGVMGLATGGVSGGILGAVSGVLGGTASTTGKGVLIGGTITDTYPGHIKIRTSSGKTVIIARKKHHRYHGRRGGGGGFSSLMKQAMTMKMLAQAMK